MKYFLRVLRLMGIVSEWSVKALEDGKVTPAELIELGELVCEALGVEIAVTK